MFPDCPDYAWSYQIVKDNFVNSFKDLSHMRGFLDSAKSYNFEAYSMFDTLKTMHVRELKVVRAISGLVVIVSRRVTILYLFENPV